MNSQDILNNLNTISEKLFKSVESQVYKVLDDLVVIGPNILNVEPLKKLCSIEKINGIIIIANSLIIMYAIYFAICQIVNLYNGENIVSGYKFIIKLVVVSLFVNFSYYICSEILNLFNLLTESIDIFCKDISGTNINFTSLKEAIINIKDFLDNDLLSINGIIKGMVSFGSVSILINFSIRYVTIIFLILLSPFAFLSLTSRATSGIFETWIKLMVINLSIQIIVKLIILIPIVYKQTNTTMYKIILVGCIYLIYKVNSFTKEIFSKIVGNTKITGVL